MATTADQLPDDPDALKAMSWRAMPRIARLIQIIKELQRHRFGRRAETLPQDQLLLGLEEAEQIEASGMEDAERHSPAERLARTAKRRTNRGALPAHLPRVERVVDIDDHACPCCRNGLHRISGHPNSQIDDLLPWAYIQAPELKAVASEHRLLWRDIGAKRKAARYLHLSPLLVDGQGAGSC